MSRGMVDTSIEHLAQVRLVAKHRQDGHEVPEATATGTVALFVQPFGDEVRAHPLVEVQVEDERHQGGMSLIRHE
ncbi:MAG TPA: hypothetical protein VG245_08665 [Candidatus Dormibacteraeota bacterium]|nr:hypothetical protein [Candidatus Dormibacteraeota bacterium]